MIFPTLDIEIKLWESGYSYVCGLDEVGRGCFAGPVVVGAVVFPKDVVLPEGIADSKLLKPQTRERLAEEIKKVALGWSIAEISVRDINNMGIGKATQKAFRKAVISVKPKPDFVVFDAFYNLNVVKIASSAYIKHLTRKRQQAVKDGDKICASISAASIIAKVYRDKLMVNLHQKYPYYGFAKHKGYGTKAHQEAIKKHGLCRIHRKSFSLGKFLT
ncbi:MAG: Ribonuclease HII [Candidatus Daviesbacteria bacterium GW2011_GWA1_41_61]|uniref:Ribonuclease HII n=1 Tax=Candidatus Daviesbacteria bacterium GW2011_GWA2_40_9 TaxID=1618424 RepID=A0A0G0WF63_9BACT|nr:MAG: Ribonuclease HII [Candidatus Daviesbacteria bacterium GW2011_GWC1_40_9]KKR82935.1 MAG: Ribonuclease HII [Candidatus Daviesbacteria bacterium GW2011_GWA2_40_9]KKR92863.1 MAG: Ribonuclease HII [Candidatus Daviesbacteria bacterium GW2011_GWB1_41_15]KKS15407.1 MAG: Ribonuclease HII [Candidatus Daviesbacteria bacterium GW2011_GWA1_41_61]